MEEEISQKLPATINFELESNKEKDGGKVIYVEQ